MALLTKLNAPLVNDGFLTSLGNIQSEINDLFQGQDLTMRKQPVFSANQFMPATDVKETKKKYLVEVEMPGMMAKDIDLEILDNTLMIRGERRSESETSHEGILRKERVYGSFYRAIPFSREINPSKVSAKLTNGVLKVEIEKIPGQSQSTHKINISE